MAANFNPPGPKGYPLVGNLLEFRRGKLEFFTRCAREYGDFARFRLGNRTVILLSDPALIEQVLVTQQRNFGKHFVLRLLDPVLGKGLVTSDGELWLRQRRLIQPAFLRTQIDAYAPIMVQHTERMLDGWQPGQTRDLHAEMTQLTLSIAAKTLLDADVSGEFNEVSSSVDLLMRDFAYRFEGLWRIPIHWPTPWNLRTRRAIRRLDQVIFGIIDRRRRGPLDGQDLLTRLMLIRDATMHNPAAPGAMTDRQLRDEVMTLFLAGHETTASALSWTWLFLAQHPEVEAKLRAELQAMLGGRSPTAADAPNLTYTEQVVLESMRVYPPVYTIGRRAIDDCQIGGYAVPANTTFLMCQWVLHRDPRFFDEPEKFRPERWAGGLLKRLPKFAYFPFGGGPRTCIGNSFAMLEAVLIVATIAQRYRFELAPEQRTELWPAVTLRPRYGIKAVCLAQSPARAKVGGS